MWNNSPTQTGTVSAAYEATLPIATGFSSTEIRNDFSEVRATSILFGAALITIISHSSAPSVDWYAKATARFDPSVYNEFLGAKVHPRVLTKSEQAIFHRALRRSAKMIYKANRDTVKI